MALTDENRIVQRPAVLLVAAIAWAAFLPAQAAPSTSRQEDKPLMESEARSIVEELFGLETGEPVAGQRSFDFVVKGFAGTSRCPLEGMRDTRCGDFVWLPSRVRVFHASWVAPVSGHLARNRVVTVDMFSESAGVSSSSLHGVLVFPGVEVGGKRRPAFAWYLTRLGRSLSLEFVDVTGDGALDLVYGYEQRFGGGIGVVARDVWAVRGLKPEKILSSGEKLSGVFMSTFDGVALHDDGVDSLGRGSLGILPAGPGRPRVLVFDKARLAGAGTTWEVHVIARLDDGWDEYLTGAPEGSGAMGTQVDVEGEPGADCTPLEVLPGLSLQARQVLLDVEASCRAARAATSSDGVPADALIQTVLGRLLAAAGARVGGMPSAAVAMVESASVSLADEWPVAWPLSALLSLHAAGSAHRQYCEAFDPAFAKCPERMADTLWYFPAFAPVRLPFEWTMKAAGRILSHRPLHGERTGLERLPNRARTD